MALDAADLAAIRAHIGTTEPPTNADLETLFTLHGTTTAVAHQVLSERLADMLAAAAKFEAEGDYAEDFTANLKYLQAKVADIGGSLPGGGVTVSRLIRSGRCR